MLNPEETFDNIYNKLSRRDANLLEYYQHFNPNNSLIMQEAKRLGSFEKPKLKIKNNILVRHLGKCLH